MKKLLLIEKTSSATKGDMYSNSQLTLLRVVFSFTAFPQKPSIVLKAYWIPCDTFNLHFNLTTSTFGVTGTHLSYILLLETFLVKNITMKHDCNHQQTIL